MTASPASGEPDAPTARADSASPSPIRLEQDSGSGTTHGRSRLGHLTLLALGVVYGDIGTSPLYAFRECFSHEYGLARTPFNVYGILSLILWAIVLTVSVKYILFIMRADNRGEGGILALLALLLHQRGKLARRTRVTLVVLGLIGAALLYGDGVITPAISVLSAVEGLEVITPAFSRLVIPASLVILLGLFLVQKRGTAKVGIVFGPLMLIWFATIGVLGLVQIVQHPGVLVAINPWFGLQFFIAHGFAGFVVLGAVVLAVTGAEALYADMGHFGRQPIRLAWFSLVLPALMLNYLGQGALVLHSAVAAENPFYLLAPRIVLYPMIALATAATVIASQALISGAFSLTQQCIQLGYCPRFNIVHTSGEHAGQIYVPSVNYSLMIGCVVMVAGFQSSTALSAAYGIAVTGTMAITTLLFTELTRFQFGWPAWKWISFVVVFMIVDLSFLGANVLKIMHGGWVPLAIALGIFTLMTTWHRGRRLTRALLHEASLPLDAVLTSIASHGVARVRGTAVFMTADATGAPMVLLHHLKHNKTLHEEVLLLTVRVLEVPDVPEGERIAVQPLEHGFWRIVAQYGFMQTPDVKAILRDAAAQSEIRARPMETTFYLGRERLIPIGNSKLAAWRKRIYVFMARNSRPASDFFGIPPNRVVELGAQLEI